MIETDQGSMMVAAVKTSELIDLFLGASSLARKLNFRKYILALTDGQHRQILMVQFAKNLGSFKILRPISA